MDLLGNILGRLTLIELNTHRDVYEISSGNSDVNADSRITIFVNNIILDYYYDQTLKVVADLICIVSSLRHNRSRQETNALEF